MDATNKEICCLMQRLLEITDRNAARYDRMIELIDSCRTTGGTPSAPSTSAGSDICDGAEVPAPASPSPVTEVPAPASSDSDANLDGQAISGVTSTPATCSTVCLPRHPEATPVMVASLLQDPTEYVLQGYSSSVSTVKETPRTDPSASTGFITTVPVTCSTYWSHQQPVAAPELVVSAPPTPTKYGLNTNIISVAAVRPALSGVLTILTPEVLSLQLYNNHELVEPSSDQYISSMVHRPRPWPSFIADHASGDETRPLPWPSFGKVNGYEFLSYAVQKVSQCYSSDSSRTESCTVIGFQISAFCGNLFTSIGYIITSDSFHSCEWIKCFSEVLLFLEYSRSASNFEQSAHVYHTTLACLFCTIFGFQWLDMVRSLELKLWSNGSRSITLWAVPLVSGNFASLSCEYLGVDTIDGLGSWIFVGSSVAVSQESSVQISTDHLIAREIAFGVLSTLVWHLLDFLCRSDVSDASYWPGYFDTGRQEKLVITAASRGSHWLVPCECGPAISSSLSALCDQWFMSPWDSGQQADSSYDQSSCANQDTSCFPGHFITGGQRQDFVACPILQLFLSGFLPSFHPLVMFELQLARSGNHWVLHSCNSGQHAPSRNSGQQLSGAFQNAAYWPANFVTSGQMQVTKDFTQRKSSGLDTMDWHILELLSSALATICWAYFQLLVHYLNNYQLTILVTAAGHRMLLARCQNGEKNSHMLLLPWVLEQKEPSITFQFQESSSRSDWCRGNQSNSSLSIEKTGLYTAGSIPSLDKLQEPMKLMAMPVSWQYFSHMELRESGNSISICLRLGSELERISVVPFLSTSCYTTIYNRLSKWYVGWEYMNSDVNTCSSCLNDGVIYTPCLCISGQILITLHKPQPPVQSISKELLIREPYGRNCCVAILSLVLHSILSWNGSSISSHVFPLSLCEKPHGTGYLRQGSIHAEVTFWLDYSFARIDKRPQARQSPHAHCSTGLQIINSVMRYLLCQLFLVRVMSWLEKLVLPTSPRPNAYCLITHTMFWGAYLSCLIICKVWQHNHQNTVQMEIGWPPRAQVGFITSKSGMPWLLVLMRIQGRRNIGVYHIYYQDQVCTDHDYQLGFSRDIGGTKKRPLSWDPGGRHMTGLYRHVVLRLPWDPGVAAAAWGQAAFQGGRDVRDPSCMLSWAGSWAVVMGLTIHQQPGTREPDYKYARHGNRNGIQLDHGRNLALSPLSLLLCFPVLAPLFFPILAPCI